MVRGDGTVSASVHRAAGTVFPQFLFHALQWNCLGKVVRRSDQRAVVRFQPYHPQQLDCTELLRGRRGAFRA